MSNTFKVEKPERPISTTFSTADARTRVRQLSPWGCIHSWLTPTQSPQGKKSRGTPHPMCQQEGLLANQPTISSPSLETDQLVQTFSINTCPKYHRGSNQYGGRSTSGGRENLRRIWENLRSEPTTETTVVPFTGWYCCKSLDHRLSHQKQEVLKSPELQGSPLQTYWVKVKKVCCNSVLWLKTAVNVEAYG